MGNGLDAFCDNHLDEITKLAEGFADYQPGGGVNQVIVRRWLGQFSNQHRALALRLAQTIQYYSTHSVNGQLRELRKLLDQHIESAGDTEASAFYIPGGRTAESGPSILHRFRNMNRMQNSSRFIELLDAPQRLFEVENPIVIFLDDFIATGKQMSDYWRDVISQLVPEYFPAFHAVVAAFPDGIKRIEGETPLTVVSVHELSSRHQLLGNANTVFSKSQKRTLQHYCNDWGNHPLGYGDIGALVAFSHGTPNNAPSVIRGSESQVPMRGILPGWEDL